MKSKKSATFELVQLCCRALDDKKAGDLAVLDVSAQSSITDYLILATATSAPHLRALRVELEKVLDANQVGLVGMETAQESGWFVIDAFDVMIHLFLEETRERYGLERLWRDASEVSLGKLLPSATPKPKAKVNVKVKVKPARARATGARKPAVRRRAGT
jgi:ribosome-associated protein